MKPLMVVFPFLFLCVSIHFAIAGWPKCNTVSFQHYLCNTTSSYQGTDCNGDGGPPNCFYSNGNCSCNYLAPCQSNWANIQVLLNYSMELDVDNGFVSLSNLIYNGNTEYNNYSTLPTGIELQYYTWCNKDDTGLTLFDIIVPFGSTQKFALSHPDCYTYDINYLYYKGPYFNFSSSLIYPEIYRKTYYTSDASIYFGTFLTRKCDQLCRAKFKILFLFRDVFRKVRLLKSKQNTEQQK